MFVLFCELELPQCCVADAKQATVRLHVNTLDFTFLAAKIHAADIDILALLGIFVHSGLKLLVQPFCTIYYSVMNFTISTVMRLKNLVVDTFCMELLFF
jgi:hypothetical protein